MDHYDAEGNEIQVGEKMPDGTIYAGISPDTGRPLFVATEDAPTLMDYAEAQKFSKTFNAAGHKDWRVPSEAERDMLFRNKQLGGLKGTFNEDAADKRSWYLSTPEFRGYNDSSNERNFSTGAHDHAMQVMKASVRFVRG